MRNMESFGNLLLVGSAIVAATHNGKISRVNRGLLEERDRDAEVVGKTPI